MATYTPVYKVTLFARRSVDPNEATVLTPAAGAPHSDPFQVATKAGIAGFQPYLMWPEGKRGRLDILTRRLEQGTLNLTFLDRQTTPGGSNLSRWVSAFFGDVNGKLQCAGIKAYVQLSTDNGVTFSDYFTGRVITGQLAGANLVTMQVRDNSADMSAEIFVGRPYSGISYVGEPQVLPVGLSVAYGTQAKATALAGTFGSSGVFRTIDVATGNTGIGRIDNLVTQALVAGQVQGITGQIAVRQGLRVRFTTGALANKEAELIKVDVATNNPVVRVYRVTRLYFKAVSDNTDPYYQGLTTAASPTGVPDGTACTFTVLAPINFSTGAAAKSTMVLTDVHPVQLWKDLLDGKFGRLTAAGAISRYFPYDSAAFAALIADTSWPTQRFLIQGPAKLQDWVEKNLLILGLGARMDGSGQVVPIDLRPPQSSPTATTITDADLVDGSIPVWSFDRDQAITVMRVKTYVDTQYDLGAFGGQFALSGVVDLPSALLTPASEEYIIPDFGSSDVGEKPFSIDAAGLRYTVGETVAGHDRREWVLSQAMAMARNYQAPFASVPQYLTLQCRRTANTTGVEIGTWRLIDCDMVPDAGSNLRGGVRLMLCVEASDPGLERTLKFLDAGPNTVATAPTVATPAQEASNTQNGITVAVTLNASSEPATLWINATSTAVGVRPADTDAGWRMVNPLGQFNPAIMATGTVTVRNVPANSRIWVRVRTEAVGGKKIASAYAYPAGTGYVATAAITAPSALASSSVSTKQITWTWTLGDATKPILFRLVGAATQVAADAATPVALVQLPAGTTSYTAIGLDTGGPWWHADVSHFDGYGGSSAVNNLAAVQATGAAPTAPNMGGCVVSRSLANSALPPATGPLVPAGSPGIELDLVPGPSGLGYDVELYRAPDSAGSPGAYTLLHTVPAALITGRDYFYRDTLPYDGVQRWYKARLVSAGANAGAYTLDVAAKPGWLLPSAVGNAPGQVILGASQTIQLAAPIFIPSSQASSWALTGSTLNPNVVGTQREFYASFTLPDNCVLTGVSLNGARVNAGDVVKGQLFYTPVGSYLVSVVQDTRTLTATGNSTDATTSLNLAGGGKIWYYQVSLKSSVAVADAVLYYVVITYTKNAYN